MRDIIDATMACHFVALYSLVLFILASDGESPRIVVTTLRIIPMDKSEISSNTFFGFSIRSEFQIS